MNTHPVTPSLPFPEQLFCTSSSLQLLHCPHFYILYSLFNCFLSPVSFSPIFPHFTVSFLKSSEHFPYQPIPLLFCLLILPYPIPLYPVLPSQTTSVYCTALHQRTEWWPCPSLWGRASTFSWEDLCPQRISDSERRSWTSRWAPAQVSAMWYDVMQCVMLWLDVIRCDMIWCDMMWCVMLWLDVIWYDMIWCDVIWCDMIWCEYYLPLSKCEMGDRLFDCWWHVY